MTGQDDRSRPDRGSALNGWRVITSVHPRAPQVLPHGPSHATMEEALGEACRRLAWQNDDDARVIRIEGPQGELIELAEIVRYCADWS